MEYDKKSFCSTAIVGQEDMKTALVLNAINPNLGGVLIRGEKGTAKSLLSQVVYSREILEKITRICIAMEVDGHRADITILKTAMTLAAFDGRTAVLEQDVLEAAKLALPHRMRRLPFEEADFDFSRLEKLRQQ